jgi:hypothetical protein
MSVPCSGRRMVGTCSAIFSKFMYCISINIKIQEFRNWGIKDIHPIFNP